MKKLIILPILILYATCVFAQENEVKEVLKNQARCWNVGDLHCFMQGYWKSDSLMFIGKNGVTYGWQKTYNHYYETYPEEAMGILNFKILDVQLLSDVSCFVVGQWLLQRKQGDSSGHFTLLFKRLEGKWVIVADHSS